MSHTNGQPVRIEDYVLMFQAQCGGLVTGELGRKLICAECKAEMRFFASDTARLR
jgi:hypothetical protein